MQTFISALLGTTFAMAVISLAYMVLMPPLSKRYSARGLYYVGVVIMIGWAVPFRPRLDFLSVQLPVMPTIEPAAVWKMIATMGAGYETNQAAQAVQTAPTIDASQGFPDSFWWVLAGIWLTGMAVVLTAQVRRHWHFMKMVTRWSEPVADPAVTEVFEAVKKEMNIAKHISLQTCPGITTPMLIGLLKPAVLLPPSGFNTDELAFILRHELVHFTRKDLWFKALALLASAIHWFNPVVYLMTKSLAVQCEMACDEKVLQGKSIAARKQYGATIIGIVRQQDKQQTSLATYFYGGTKGMKARIFSIMDTRKKKAGAVIVSIALVCTVGAGAAFAFHAPQEMAKELPQSQSKSAESGNVTSVQSGSASNQGTVGAHEGGGIQSSDGKLLSIWLGANQSTNFGKAAWAEGETITWKVESEDAGELEIGVISVTTNIVYSETVRTGTGNVVLTIPEDGEYRIYINNKSSESANFQLELHEPMEGPLV
ncbi:M56 family metallopeptidase [Paenibacillaceae bacterium]|nr:M56 family metallopeptidase [Paenibacillaceae bacterium]